MTISNTAAAGGPSVWVSAATFLPDYSQIWSTLGLTEVTAGTVNLRLTLTPSMTGKLHLGVGTSFTNGPTGDVPYELMIVKK